MRALSASAAILALLVLAATACSTASEPARTQMTIGVHEVSVTLPDGWLHFDHGREHLIQQGIAQVSLADIGPVTREAWLRELRHALGLFREGRAEDARAHLEGVELRTAVPSARRWKELRPFWRTVRNSGIDPNVGPEQVETAYLAVLGEVDAMVTPDLATLVDRVMPELGLGAQREISDRRPVVIGGHSGMRVDTWDRLSHDHPARYLFVMNEGHLLVARTELGRFETLKPAFEALVESLEIDSPADSGD